jgi:hypothetical protein
LRHNLAQQTDLLAHQLYGLKIYSGKIAARLVEALDKTQSPAKSPVDKWHELIGDPTYVR